MNDNDKAGLALIVAGWLILTVVACVLLLLAHCYNYCPVELLTKLDLCSCCM